MALTIGVDIRGTKVLAGVVDPAETGVYVVENSRPTVVPPGIVNWQTGGVAKSTFSLGIVKGDKNGKINGTKTEFNWLNLLSFLSTPADMSVEEYQLLRLHRKGNRREFRSVTGGVLHVSGGATRDDVAFQSEKIGIRTWRISLSDCPTENTGFSLLALLLRHLIFWKDVHLEL